MSFRVSRSAAAGKPPEQKGVEEAMKEAIALGLAAAARIKEANSKPQMPAPNPTLGIREYKKRKVGTSRTTAIRVQRIEKTVKVAAVPKKPKELKTRSVVVPSPKKPKTRMVKPGSVEANRLKIERQERDAQVAKDREKP